MPPVKWNDEMFESKRKLRIGYYTFDGFTRCAPAYEVGCLFVCDSSPFSLQRAVLQVKKKLEEQGHELIPFKVPSPIDAFALYAGGVTGDGGYYIFNQMKTVRWASLMHLLQTNSITGSADSRMQDRFQHNALPFLGAQSRGSIRQI